jgi:hypothetical protein
MYHCTVIGLEPLAVTVSVALDPDAMVVEEGFEAMVGGVHETVTVAVALSAEPQPLKTRAQ